MNDIKLSICIITYNHERFIAQCLDSILPEISNLNAEIIIGDDCSTDATRDIVLSYARKYPSLIKAILQQKNIDGGVTNFRSVIKLAKGEYVARIDGDDYCYPGKIKAQINILDRRHDVSIVGHYCDIVDENGVIINPRTKLNGDENIDFNLEYFISSANCLVNSSIMYRRSALDSLDAYPAFDFYINFIILKNGNGLILSKYYGAYRVISGISRNPSRYKEIFELVEKTFFDALSSGVSIQSVTRGRMYYREALLNKYISNKSLPYLVDEKFIFMEFFHAPKKLKFFKFLRLFGTIETSFFFLNAVLNIRIFLSRYF